MQPLVEAKGSPRFLGNGQRIHVAAQHNDRTGLFVRADAIALGRGGTGADKAHNAGTIDERGMGDVHLVQTCLDIGRRLPEDCYRARASGVDRVATQRARLQKPELLRQDRHR